MSAEAAEAIAADMVAEGRMAGSIDQVGRGWRWGCEGVGVGVDMEVVVEVVEW